MKLKANKGFTLVELIVVIAVLALLAVIAVVAFRGIQRSARIETALNSANTLVRHLNLYESVGAGFASAGDAATAIPAGTHSFPLTEDLSAEGPHATLTMDPALVTAMLSATGYPIPGTGVTISVDKTGDMWGAVRSDEDAGGGVVNCAGGCGFPVADCDGSGADCT